MKTLSVIVSVLMLTVGSLGQGCATWNYQPAGAGFPSNYFNANYHITGGHSFRAYHVASCSYFGGTGGLGSPCSVYLTVGDNPSSVETGLVLTSAHVDRFAQTGASAGGTGAVAATAKAAIAIESCLFSLCNFTVSITALNGVTVSNGSATVWTAEDNFTTSCTAEAQACPIIIDTAGEGFQLSDAAHGVVTDMVIPGQAIRLAWTLPGSHNAFLWLDNHLFGNHTEQPPSDTPNGFAALAVYDSNGDGVIDARDAVFAQLRLWIDANHDGVTQANELSTLPSLGVYSIGLHYTTDKYTDAYRNHYRYRGTLRAASPTVDRTIYDVFLASE
jgi:hypothetical protein